MPLPSSVKKDIFYTIFLCIITISIVVVITLILTSCSFINSNKCLTFDKHIGTITNIFVGSHYNYGYSDIRYYIVSNVTINDKINCIMVSDSNYKSYSEALNSVNDMLLNSSTNVYMNGNNKGCLDQIPKEDNTGLIVIVVLLFVLLLPLIYWICLKVEKLIAIRKFINGDNTNYNLLTMNDNVISEEEKLKQPYVPIYVQNNFKNSRGILDKQIKQHNLDLSDRSVSF